MSVQKTTSTLQTNPASKNNSKLHMKSIAQNVKNMSANLGGEAVDDLDPIHVRMDDYPTVIYELNENALNLIYNENYDRASTLLLKAAFFLQKTNALSRVQDAGTVLLTHHNLALCYQKLGVLEECGNHIDICLKQIPSLIESKPTLENKVKTSKYLCKLHMQYCAVLSQQNKHQEALEHAKYGAKYIHLTIRELQKIVENLLVEDDNSLLERTSRKILPILKELSIKIIPEEKSTKFAINEKVPTKLDVRSLFGFTPCGESVVGLNIGNIMQLSPLSIVDILSEYDKQLELTRESLLEKIALLVVAYFCLSTEKRFLSQELPTLLKESEFYHAKALEVACCFLPAECPLVAHVYMSYQKHHSIIQQAIPEDCEAKEEIDLIKPLNGAPQLPFQPIIRSIKGLNFCLSPSRIKSYDIINVLSTSPRTLAGKYEKPKLTTFYNTPNGTTIPKKSLNKSAMETNPKPVIRIHKRQQQSVNIDTVITKNDISFISNISMIEEPIVIPKRPKSSQSGISHQALMKSKAEKGKSAGPKKYKRRHVNSHTDDLSLIKPEPKGKEQLNGSFHKYMNSLGLAKGADLIIKNVKTQPKNAMFAKPLIKKSKNEEGGDLFSKVLVDNFPIRKDFSRPGTEVCIGISVIEL